MILHVYSHFDLRVTIIYCFNTGNKYIIFYATWGRGGLEEQGGFL